MSTTTEEPPSISAFSETSNQPTALMRESLTIAGWVVMWRLMEAERK